MADKETPELDYKVEYEKLLAEKKESDKKLTDEIKALKAEKKEWTEANTKLAADLKESDDLIAKYEAEKEENSEQAYSDAIVAARQEAQSARKLKQDVSAVVDQFKKNLDEALKG